MKNFFLTFLATATSCDLFKKADKKPMFILQVESQLNYTQILTSDNTSRACVCIKHIESAEGTGTPEQWGISPGKSYQ